MLPVLISSSFFLSFFLSFTHLAYIGGGTFGQVLGGVDTVTGENVAIKKLTRAFATTEDAKRAYREVKLLRLLCADGQGEDILQLKFLYRCDLTAYYICHPFSFSPSPQTTLEELVDVYIVCERAPSNLHEVLHSNPLTEDHVRLIGYQLFRGLKYLHSANILHRDLKPSNIAVFEGYLTLIQAKCIVVNTCCFRRLHPHFGLWACTAAVRGKPTQHRVRADALVPCS